MSGGRSVGIYHCLALRADGVAIAWGYNFYSQSSVPAGLGYLSAVAAGGYHSLAIADNYPPSVQAAVLNAVRGANSFHVSIPTHSGRVYVLEYKNSLVDIGWTALPLVGGNGKTQTLTDPFATSLQRFYRVREW
jgi:hypothetical protein